MEFLERLPHWLRWILFLPTAILATIIINPMVIIGNKLTGFGGVFWEDLLVWSIAASASGAAFVWIGAKIVPKFKFIIALVMTIIYNIVGAIALFAKFLLDNQSNVDWVEIGIYFTFGLLATICVCYLIHKNADV